MAIQTPLGSIKQYHRASRGEAPVLTSQEKSPLLMDNTNSLPLVCADVDVHRLFSSSFTLEDKTHDWTLKNIELVGYKTVQISLKKKEPMIAKKLTIYTPSFLRALSRNIFGKEGEIIAFAKHFYE